MQMLKCPELFYDYDVLQSTQTNSSKAPRAGPYSGCLSPRLSTHRIEIEALEVSIIGSLDGRGMLGMDNIDAGYQKIKNIIKITSSSDEQKINKLIETVKKHCPVVNSILKAPEFIVTHKINS